MAGHRCSNPPRRRSVTFSNRLASLPGGPAFAFFFKQAFLGLRDILKREKKNVYYTYILESLSHRGKRYIGHTSDLKERLAAHDAGKCQATRRYRPWKLLLYLAFQSLHQAQHFEIYLKTGSGHAFAKRHRWR